MSSDNAHSPQGHVLTPLLPTHSPARSLQSRLPKLHTFTCYNIYVHLVLGGWKLHEGHAYHCIPNYRLREQGMKGTRNERNKACVLL